MTDDTSYKWVDALRDALERAESEDMRVYVVSRSATGGALGLGTCLRREPGGASVRVFVAPDAPAFAPTAPAFAAQVRKDCVFNVLRAGVWGTYRHLQLTDINDATLQVTGRTCASRTVLNLQIL